MAPSSRSHHCLHVPLTNMYNLLPPSINTSYNYPYIFLHVGMFYKCMKQNCLLVIDYAVPMYMFTFNILEQN